METQQEVTREARFYLFLCVVVCLFDGGKRGTLRRKNLPSEWKFQKNRPKLMNKDNFLDY